MPPDQCQLTEGTILAEHVSAEGESVTKPPHAAAWMGDDPEVVVLPRVILRVTALVTGFLALLLPSMCSASITVEHAFCRGGQVFLHWSDPDAQYACYHVYRSSQQITVDNLASAELVESDAQLNSAKDLTATYIASRKSLPDPNIGLRLTDLGDRLDPTDCLEVMTVHENGSHYYAVVGVDLGGIEDTTIVADANSLASPVAESTGTPQPVLDDEGVVVQGGWDYPWMTYIWYRRSDEALHDGEPTKVTVTLPNSDTTKKYPTMLYLHAIGGANETVIRWDTVAVSPCDFTSGLPYSHNSWWHGYCDSYPSILSGTVVNYTETMLLHMLDWAKTSCPVDPDRVFLQGGSMGGTGSLSFGLRHPELFAGICAVVPQVNPGLPGIGWSQDQLTPIWGSVADNLPTNDGMRVWDRMSTTEYVSAHREDLPFVKVQNSKNDTTLPWFQIPDFYRNLNSGRHGFVAAWGQGGHGASGTGLPPEYLAFDLYGKIRLNRSYVVVSNSSASNDPGNGDPLDGDSVGQMNAGYDWNIISDTTEEWSADIKYTAGAVASADISARRLQSFNFAGGSTLLYSLRDMTDGKVLRWGRVTAERDRFFVIPSLPFDGGLHRLVVWKSSEQRASDVGSLPEGASVDLDAVVVTGVFADVCYARAPDRVPSIAILGATGLTEGSLIRLRGTKTMLSEMPAVNASPATPPSYGKVELRPFGVVRPFAVPSGPAELGSLVKLWGTVRDSGESLFTVDTYAGVEPVLIFGDTGTPPAEGALVFVTGICSQTSGGSLPTYGIRVRRPSDVAGL